MFGVKENNKYQIKFEFKNGESYTLSYSYDSKTQAIKYENVKFGPAKMLNKFLEKQVLDLESALVCAMQQNEVDNLTAENIKLSKEQIKNNLEKIDLDEDFLIDIIPDIFKLQNLCENNLEVEVPYMPYMGKQNEINEGKTEKIIKQIDSLYDKSGEKKITFVEKGVQEYHLDDDMNSWIQGYVCGQGGSNGYDNKYQTKYANWKLKEIEQQEEKVDSDHKRKESQNLSYKQLTNTYDLDSQKSKTDGKISLGGKIARIIFLILLIAFAISLPTYLGIVGLLFSNVAIPIIVFSAEAILITLIIILILSIRNIYRQNNLLQKQIGLSDALETEDIDKNRDEEENKNNPEPDQLKNNGQNLNEYNQSH